MRLVETSLDQLRYIELNIVAFRGLQGAQFLWTQVDQEMSFFRDKIESGSVMLNS